jgi:short-subunit dehydrogenase
MTIAEKTIVITGASKGLGRAMAIHFSQRRANVILAARTETALRQVQEEITSLTGTSPTIITADIASEDNVDRMAATIQEHCRKVDVLVNNAGFATYRASEKLTNQEMRRHFEVNFFGAYHCVKALLPLLKKSDSGYILNIGSLFSRVALAENSVYAATKFAMAGFTEGLRRELKPFGIGVGLFLPGAMRTAFQEQRDEGAVKVPDWMMLDPQKVAIILEKMICRKQKTVILPKWMLTLFKVKNLFV